MAIKFLSDLETKEDIQFQNASGSNAGKIAMSGDDLVISNAVGDVLFGDTNADVYIGDGVNSVDVLFEQSGSIKAEDGSTGVTLTLGSSDTTLSLYAPQLTTTMTIGTSGSIDYTPDTGTVLSFDSQSIIRRLNANGGISIGHDDQVIIAGGDTSSTMDSNITGEVVAIGAEGGLNVYAFPNNDTSWSNRVQWSFGNDSYLTTPKLKISSPASHTSEATALMIDGSNIVGTRELGSLAFSSATYDNYGSWNLKTGGVQRTTVGSGGTLDIVGGTNVTATYSAGGVVTLASTDTWLTNTNARPGIVASGANQINKVWKTDESGNPAWRDDSDTVYSTATSSTLGLVKIGYAENGKNYPVELSSGKMFVNVPWTDNNTTYSNATTSADGLMSSTDKTKLDGIATGADVTPSWVPSSDPSYLTTSSAASTYATLDHGHSNATTSSAGFMSSTDKTKLDGIASGAEVNVQSDWNATTGDAFIKNKPTLGTAAATASTDYISATSADTALGLITFASGISTDGNSKFYNWRALNNSSNSGNSYWKIADISGADQSSRFIVTLAGRSTSYSDNTLPAMGHVVGQLNNDNNWDLVFYNHSTASSEVVTEVAIVDDGILGVELWIKTGNYAEITASGHISDGSFTVYSNASSDGFTSSPTGYTVVTEYTSYNSGNLTAATTSATGLMSSTDKTKLDGIAASANNYSLPAGSSTVRGGFKIGYTENGKNYPVEVSSEKMFVNVPWTDNNTTYSNATTSADGLMSSTDKSKLDGIATGADVTPSWVPSSDPSYLTTSSAASTYATTDHGHSDATTSSAGFMSSTDKTKLDGIAASANNYSLPTASSTVLGGIKVGTNLSISNGVLSATDTDTWVSNTNARAGYVASGAGQVNKVWKTDASGNPAWRDDSNTNTNYYVSGLSFATGTGVLTATVTGATNQTVDLDGRYLELGGGTMTGNIILGSNKIAADTTSPTAHIQVGAGTTNTGNRSDVALLGESNSGGVANALGLINTASGANSNGVALNFHNGSAWSPTGQIITRQNSSGTSTDSSMQFFTYSGGLNHRMSIKSDGTIRFNAYGAGLIASDASGNLSVDTSTYLTSVPSKSVGIAELDVTDGSSGQVLTTDGNGTLSFSTVSTGGSNYYLDGITRTASTNTLVFSVSGTTNQSYTFGANAFTSYTDHSTQGYLTSETYTAHEDTSTLQGTYGSTANGTKIDEITVDANGHITAITTGATGNMTGFYVEDGDGTEVQINNANEWKFVEGGGIDINWTDTSTGSDTDPYDLTFSIAANGVSATQLNVVGDGTSGQVLTSDGDGTFSWTNKTTNTNTVTSVGVSGSETTGTVTLAGSGATTVSQEGSTITIDSTNTQYSNATTSAAGLMSSTDKTKLDGIATNADVTPSWVPATDPSYLTAHPAVTEATTNLSNSGRTYIQSITLDSNGHVTGVSTGTETVTNTNTTYSAGSGLDLSSTTFSVEADLRDGITHVGKDTSNYITFDSTNGRIDFYAGGVFVARMESDGDLHIKGDVIAFSSIFA